MNKNNLIFLVVLFSAILNLNCWVLCYFVSDIETNEKVEEPKKSFHFHGNGSIMIEYPCSNQIFLKIFPCPKESEEGMGCIEIILKKSYLLNSVRIFLGANNEKQWSRIMEVSDLIADHYHLNLLELVYAKKELQQIHLELKDKVLNKRERL
jgi:hypothetical protein